MNALQHSGQDRLFTCQRDPNGERAFAGKAASSAQTATIACLCRSPVDQVTTSSLAAKPLVSIRCWLMTAITFTTWTSTTRIAATIRLSSNKLRDGFSCVASRGTSAPT